MEHHIEVARFPNWEHTTQVRHAKLVENKLQLSSPQIFALGKVWVTTLTWHRLASQA